MTRVRNGIIGFVLLSGLSLSAHQVMAQAPSEAEMQKMMQQVEAMQRCFAGVDQNALEQLGNRGEAMGDELRELCEAGERDAAMSKATAFVKEMKASKDLQKVRECGEQAQQMMPPSMRRKDKLDDFLAMEGHVCDQL